MFKFKFEIILPDLESLFLLDVDKWSFSMSNLESLRDNIREFIMKNNDAKFVFISKTLHSSLTLMLWTQIVY